MFNFIIPKFPTKIKQLAPSTLTKIKNPIKELFNIEILLFFLSSFSNSLILISRQMHYFITFSIFSNK